MLKILVADDEPSVRLAIADTLSSEGYDVTAATDGSKAIALATAHTYDVVITDIRMPGADGMAVLSAVKNASPDTSVILITAYGEIEDAVRSLKEGAEDYLIKPFDLEELRVRVERLAKVHKLQSDLHHARAVLKDRPAGTRIIGSSPPMMELLRRIEMIAESDASVLITGETGTGKELVAHALHGLSTRSKGPFVAVNCTAFPDTLLEAELFGHERGAFTGAVKSRVGRFQAASGGTLLLDEIGDMPMMAQSKLLRVLEEGAVEPLGTNQTIKVDVRVLSATHQNLKERIKEGVFREDLYYRLNVLDLCVPPLREREGDKALLAEYFLDRYKPPGAETPSISARAWDAFSEYGFPGNVREFQHAIERAVVLSRGAEIDIQHLPEDIVGSDSIPGRSKPFSPLAGAMKEYERGYLLRALHLAHGKRTRAAELLGISRKNLWEKLRAHDVKE